ncbi:MAG: alpha/beta fold hydrolase [Ktedonobacterales bacterium]
MGQRETGVADVNGAKLYYEVAGSGQPLVLLHAGIADNRMWDDQFEVFARHYRVIRYDMRGIGGSDMPPGPFAFRDDLYGLLRHLGIEKAHLVGCSLGGTTVLDFGLEHPEMATALILVGSGLSGYQWINQDDPVVAEIEAAIAARDFERANELEMRIWVDGSNRTPEQVAPGVRERVAEMNLASFKRSDEQDQAQPERLDPPAIGRLREITAPTLVIVGDRDTPDIKRIADLLAQGIHGARKVVIADAAHVPNMEWPEQFNCTVLDFLGGL